MLARLDLNSNLYAACRNFFMPNSISVSEGANTIICLCVIISSTAVATLRTTHLKGKVCDGKLAHNTLER